MLINCLDRPFRVASRIQERNPERLWRQFLLSSPGARVLDIKTQEISGLETVVAVRWNSPERRDPILAHWGPWCTPIQGWDHPICKDQSPPKGKLHRVIEIPVAENRRKLSTKVEILTSLEEEAALAAFPNHRTVTPDKPAFYLLGGEAWAHLDYRAVSFPESELG